MKMAKDNKDKTSVWEAESGMIFLFNMLGFLSEVAPAKQAGNNDNSNGKDAGKLIPIPIPVTKKI